MREPSTLAKDTITAKWRSTVELSRPGGRRPEGRLERFVRRPASHREYASLSGICHMCSSGSLLPELLGKPDENSFGAPDVAEPIRIFVLDHFADELRAAFPEPGERIVDVLHGEHDAQVAESVHRGAAVIGDHRRREESGDLEPAVTVRRTHHGNLDAHVAQSSDAICPVSFDWGAPLELEAKFGEELNGGIDVFYHDADVVHTLDRHDVSLASNAAVSSRERANASRGLLHCDVRRTSLVLRPLHVPEEWRIESEDALDVLSKGRRHQPLSPRDVHHF